MLNTITILKHLFYISLTLLLINDAVARKHLNVMTFNIRLDLVSDSLNDWAHRKDKVISQILFHETHILGIQEGRPHQMKDMQLGLPHFAYVGEPRDQSGEWTEYSAIWYDSTRLTLIDQSTFWLSEHPSVKWQKGWDAALPRIATFALFYDKLNNDTIYVFNTHFDHRGSEARHQAAKLLLDKVTKMTSHHPCIVMGDFNATPDEAPIAMITSKNGQRTLTDTYRLSQHYGPQGTFNGFKINGPAEKTIDYIFITDNFDVLQHATLSQTWNGRFSSDHFPVYVRLLVKK